MPRPKTPSRTETPPPCSVTIRVSDGRLLEELSPEERQALADRLATSWAQGPGLAIARRQIARERRGQEQRVSGD